jgi:polyisoprenoid-binding protein YceI
MNMKTRLITSVAVGTFALGALAAPLTFDFKDPKGVNNAVFKLDAPLEAINGSANGVSGTALFDPENPGAARGRIVVAADTLIVPNPVMKGHLHGEQWMDVAKFKEIAFEVREFKHLKTDGNVTTADAVGHFTCHGVTREMTAPVKITYLKDKLGQRVPKMEGDLLVVRSHFTIKRSDYGINPAAPTDKVADEIEITLSVAGASPKA